MAAARLDTCSRFRLVDSSAWSRTILFATRSLSNANYRPVGQGRTRYHGSGFECFRVGLEQDGRTAFCCSLCRCVCRRHGCLYDSVHANLPALPPLPGSQFFRTTSLSFHCTFFHVPLPSFVHATSSKWRVGVRRASAAACHFPWTNGVERKTSIEEKERTDGRRVSSCVNFGWPRTSGDEAVNRVAACRLQLQGGLDPFDGLRCVSVAFREPAERRSFGGGRMATR